MDLRITEHPTREDKVDAPSCSVWKSSLYPKIIADKLVKQLARVHATVAPYRGLPGFTPEALFRGSELVEPQHEFLDLG